MKRLTITISLILVLLSITTTIFVLENLTFVLEQTTVLSKKPVKIKINKDLIHRDILYDRKTNSHLDVYSMPKAEASSKKHFVLIFIPGGLWQGSNKKHFKHIAGIAHEQKMVTVIPEIPHYYGLIRRSLLSEKELSLRRIKTQMNALRQAILWVQKNIIQYEGDPQNLFMMAFGSGAQMGGVLLFSDRYLNAGTRKSFKKMIMISPILDLEKTSRIFYEHSISYVFKKESLKLFSPHFLYQRNKKNSNIPILILSPEFDYPFLQLQSQEFAKISFLIQRKIIPNTTRKSILFELGRRNTLTKTAIDFLNL